MKKLLAIFALSASAYAGTITQTLSVPATSVAFTTTLTFNQFDPTLGTLVDIKFTIAGTSTDQDIVTNTSGKAGTFTFSAVTDFSLTDPDGNTTVEETPSSAKQKQNIANGATFTFTGAANGTATTTFDGATGFNTSFSPVGTTFDDPINVATYKGVGTINFDFAAGNLSTAQGPSSTQLTSGTAGGTITLIYDYIDAPPPVTTGIPEPATMMLLGSALLGLGTLRKFRNKSKN